MKFNHFTDIASNPKRGGSHAIKADEAGIIYDVFGPNHRQGAMDVLTWAFVNEPATAWQSIGRPSGAQWRRFIEFYMDECSTNGLSTVALDGHDGETVVGAIISRDFLRPPDPRVIEFVDESSTCRHLIQSGRYTKKD